MNLARALVVGLGVLVAGSDATSARPARRADRAAQTTPSGTATHGAPAPAPTAAATSSPRAGSAPGPVSLDDARRLLWPGGTAPPQAASCAGDRDPVGCMVALAWAPAGPELRSRALALWHDLGVAPGVETAFVMDGGYRGQIQIAPELPLGRYAQQFEWADHALREQERFYTSLVAPGGAALAYRWRPAELRFFRSVARQTPAAFAQDWHVSYNVVGRINDSQQRVTTTLFHEVFHLNDQAHGEWSERVLGPIYSAIVARCGARTPCLSPYAPNSLRVRNGTFYSFQPGNDVREYAAELCVRYYLEQSGQHRGPAFKCLTPENARAWDALVQEFFAGVDRVPACPR